MIPEFTGPAPDSAYALLDIIDFLCLGAGIYLLLALHDRQPRAGYLLTAIGLGILALRMVPEQLFAQQPAIHQAAMTLTMAMAGVLISWGTLALTAHENGTSRPHRPLGPLVWAAAGVAALLSLVVWLLPFWGPLRDTVLAASADDVFLRFEQGLRVAVGAALLACGPIAWERRCFGPVISRMFATTYALWGIALLIGATRVMPPESAAWTAHIVRVLGSILLGNALAIHAYRAEREARERQQRLALIDTVASAAIAARRLQPMINAATERIHALLDAEWAATYLIDDKGSRLIASYRTDGGNGLPEEVNVDSEHPVARAFATKTAGRFTITNKGDQEDEVLALPLTGLDASMGVLLLGGGAIQHLSEADVETLANAASHVGIIIQHMQLLEHVREARDRWRQTFDAITELLTVHDCEGRIVAANAAVQEFTKMSETEMLGQHLSKVLPETGEEQEEQLTHCCQVGAPLETSLHRTGGRIHEVRVMPLRSDDGEIRGCVRVARDVTSRWQVEERLALSERRYRELAENATDIIYTHDLEGNFRYVNRAAMDILGYSRQEFTHLQFWDVVAPESLPAAREYVHRLLAGETQKGQIELHLVCADGSMVVVQLRANVLKRAGRNDAIHGIARDITAEKQLATQLIQADRLASAGTLIAGIAHEFNNPLTTIAGYADLLRAQLKDTEHEAAIATIADEAERCRHMARSLLNFARQTDDEAISFDINELVQGVLELRAYDLRAADIEVHTFLAEDIPEVRADYGQIQQVIYNLIDNSHYALRQQGGGTITIETSFEAEVVQIDVRDDGPGVPEAIKDSIFEPFFTTKPRGEGTGLGLNICRRIIDSHGGRIEYINAERGAHFRVILPASSKTPATVREVTVSETEEPMPLGRVLFIDDEPALCSLVREFLERMGHHVVTAATGEDGLAMALDDEFDVIICDMRLPGMSGEEVCEQLLVRQPQLIDRIIVATGDILSPQTQAFFERTGLPLVHKPFKLNELAAIVADFIAGRQVTPTSD